ncbi:HupE/UreJ family protein [Roseomonas sp. CAU 1739]|uniref:HupE/UreJ family protein n=1 Tax=Roseomonas sp. CAU 1739 TaxID=3140364 RepID=UPI00325B0B7D
MKRLAALIALLPLPALAHHAMGGMMPVTWGQAFASGVGHPVIGVDHLAFLLATGVLAAALPAGIGLTAILAFVLGGFAGSLIHIAGFGLGPVEVMVSVTVLAVGVALLWNRIPARLLPVAFGIAGLFHGHAFAEAIIGAEQGPLAAYLAALALTQAAIGLGAMMLARHFGARLPRLREATGVCAAVAGGLFLAASLVA